MAWLIRTLRYPVTESKRNLIVLFCVVTIGVMSFALVWQAQIIANQREAIQLLEQLKSGG
jgi:Tfp pilus assembly protein PilN